MLRKNKLLIAAAVAALTAGSGLAFAQGVPDPNLPTKANPAAKSAPAEKVAPAAKAPAINPGAAELKGAQKSEDKAAPANKMGQTSPAIKSKTETTGQAPSQGTKSKAETTGQAPSQNQMAPKATPKEDKLNNSGDMAKPNQPSQATEPSTTQKSGGTAAGSTSTSASVTLSTEQKTKIHQVIISDRSAPRVASVTFQLNIGVAIPRTQRLAPVPVTIVEIQPSWRGFEYFLVGDEIVIVNPRTLEIVAIIPA